MTAKRTLLLILALVLLIPVFTSCDNNVQGNSSSCGYPAEITVGNSTKKIATGSCAGHFGSTGVTVQVNVGQSLTIHFSDYLMNSARSDTSKVLELTSENSLEQRYQALAPGASEILYSPPIGIPTLCPTGSGGTMAEACVIAQVTVTPSCTNKSAGSCKSSNNRGATASRVSNPQIPPSIAAIKAQQSPLAVICKPGFFTKAQTQLLAQQFGFIECFRFTGEDQWVVIGDGLPINPPPSTTTPGGIIVALEKCAGSDTTCLSPSTVHKFSNFTVYYPPQPRIDGFASLPSTSYGNLLSIDDGTFCTPITFDMTNGKWYPKTASKKLLETTPGSVKSLNAPAPVTGTEALTQEAPSATASAC